MLTNLLDHRTHIIRRIGSGRVVEAYDILESKPVEVRAILPKQEGHTWHPGSSALERIYEKSPRDDYQCIEYEGHRYLIADICGETLFKRLLRFDVGRPSPILTLPASQLQSVARQLFYAVSCKSTNLDVSYLGISNIMLGK